MIYHIGYYLFYLFYYGVRYKTEIGFVRYIVHRFLLTPRIKYEIRAIVRRHINIIQNYI